MTNRRTVTDYIMTPIFHPRSVDGNQYVNDITFPNWCDDSDTILRQFDDGIGVTIGICQYVEVVRNDDDDMPF